MKWVESEPDAYGFGGGGGNDWVEKHLEAWVNVAGTLLGVPKAMTAFMSGEMRDTVEIVSSDLQTELTTEPARLVRAGKVLLAQRARRALPSLARRELDVHEGRKPDLGRFVGRAGELLAALWLWHG